MLNASVMSAHTAERIISIVTVETAFNSAAVAVALAVSEAPRRPAYRSATERLIQNRGGFGDGGDRADCGDQVEPQTPRL